MTESLDPHGFVGRPLRRVEDRPLLLGAGLYTDDIRLPGALHVALVRSPHAHARIARLGVGAARGAPGVVAVITGTEVTHLGHLRPNRLSPSMKIPPHTVLAQGVARGVGEPVAAVVAETAYAARDAAERVEVEYEPLAAMADAAAALAPGAPALFEALGDNVLLSHRWRAGDAEAALAAAAHRVRVAVRQPRLSAMAMEPRGILAWHDRASGELRLWASTQAPFRVRADIAACTGFPESRIRVVAPQVGGGFGVKGSPYAEDVLVAWLALTLERPVKWVATRSEDFVSTQQGRGGAIDAELALSGDGKITALRARVSFAVGTRLTMSAGVPAWNCGRTMPGAYVVPAVDIETVAALTTTPPTGAYRGAGRPEGVFVVERLMDKAARALGMDPAEIRRLNFVPRAAFPYRTATGNTYDSGDYAAALACCLEAAGYEALRAEQREARARGEVTGIGVISYVEPSALGWESGSVRVERSGAVTVVTGSSAHGQGHETTWAQIVADALGVTPEEVVVRHGDTAGAPQGFGTFGSRSTALGGSAALEAATQVRAQGRRLAAALLEAGPADLVLVDGGFRVAGVPDRRVSWRQVAEAAYGPAALRAGHGPGLEATVFFEGKGELWSFGSCVAVVRIDGDTGEVSLARCIWADDAGVIVNPLLAEGQLHGAYAQGAGQALLEALVFDEEGQLLTGSLMDYAVPRLGDFPEPVLAATVTPSPFNPLGAKGLGEAGCIALPPAIVNAVLDALSPFGVEDLDMPLTREKVWRALHPGLT
ncbi:MAG: xanthine dehydrogenase family protein molybdopterin-binding subunit [Candidatus Rokubacteria bacterium]|nr:xanthine dehydrogenase family protein molybdopterin-binding subunit [Candidatus Rokubacteria bacterium]